MDVKRFFEERLERFGETPEALDWNAASQRKRFQILAEVGPMGGKSVLDLGCGLGDLYPFLIETFGPLDYTGFDFSAKMVASAAARNPNTSFSVVDVLREAIPGRYDYVLSSGLHNLETGENDSEIEVLIGKAYGAARQAAALNMLSTYADYVDEGCHQYDPVSVLSVAMKHTRFSVIRHDYMPHDFTLYMYRGPQEP